MKISRELIFELSEVRNLPFRVLFSPGSESSGNYGNDLILTGIFTDSDSQELLANLFSSTPLITQGLIKAEVANNTGLNSKQIKNLRDTGFNTQDIFEISYR